MRFTIFITLIVMLSIGYADGRNGNPDVKVRIAATVVDYLEMITLSDIDVGTVIPGDDILRLDPRNDTGAGMIKIRGRRNSSIQLSYSAQVEMVNLTTNTTLAVNYSVAGNTDNNQSASDTFTINPTTVTLNNSGEYFLWIGCEFSLLNLSPGQYDGDFVVEVDYN